MDKNHSPYRQLLLNTNYCICKRKLRTLTTSRHTTHYLSW